MCVYELWNVEYGNVLVGVVTCVRRGIWLFSRLTVIKT